MSAPTNPRVSKRKSRLPLSTNSKKKRSNGGSSNIAEGSSSSVGGSTVDDGGLHVCSLSQEAEDRIVDKLFNKLSNHGLLQTLAVGEVVSNQQAGAISSEDIPSTLSSDGNISGTSDLSIGNNPSTSNPIFSYNLGISAHVSDKLKSCIWQKVFVEFSSLLPEGPSEGFNIDIENSGNDKLLKIVSKPKSKVLNIENWLKSFHIFMDIYLQKYQNSYSGLLAYSALIQDLSKSYGQKAFLFYDSSFRNHMQSQPLQWGIMHSELWLRATTLYGARSQNIEPPKQKRMCYAFNQKNCCTRTKCTYNHLCLKCGGKHPRFRCFRTDVSKSFNQDDSERIQSSNNSFRASRKQNTQPQATNADKSS
ncbi:hypothetical protein LOTGIDRAFT_157141 [Lottia gigantea]|uniref:C3H1-type domain-containing protein n=1 Tax=Lottia gigantea TaxID=225164 RepID=V4ADC2_LOTGI|nr:hypothetical protein LOTGIDRAFT_157141 [Lottia gigantea]ESP02004.1 hypothetical protein LOTGIDRAFT_157141 [Lottia gigantea]